MDDLTEHLCYYKLFCKYPWSNSSSVLFFRSAAAATQGCGTSRERYSPDTERPAPCGHRLPIRSSPRCPVGGQWDRREPITARPALRTKMSAICSAQNIKLFQQSISDINTWAPWRSAEDRDELECGVSEMKKCLKKWRNGKIIYTVYP